jgi:hypothetical protein
VAGKVSAVFALDLRSLAAFRMGLALLIIADLARRSADLVAHYTDDGILPREALADARLAERLSVHSLAGNWEAEAALFIIAAVVAILLLIGYKTRVVTLISLILLISLHNRNPFILSGADALLRVILFWAIFLPCGAKWSIDSWLRGNNSVRPVTVANIGTVAYIVQVLALYWFAVLFKSGSDWRTDGTAVYYALSLGQLSTPLGGMLLQYRELLPIMTRVVLLVEAIAPFLLVVPIVTARLRLAAILMLLLMHVGFGVALANLGLFPYIDGVVLLALLPSVFWGRLNRLLSTVSQKGRDCIHQRSTWLWTLISRDGTARSPMRLFEKASHAQTPVDALKMDSARRLSRPMTGLAACCLAYILLANVATLPRSPIHLPWLVGGVGRLIGLNQGWAMFSPNVLKISTWYMAPGELRNGQQVDAYNRGSNITFDRPSSISATYHNDHWFKYFEWFGNVESEPKRVYLGAYLCRQWNAGHDDEEHLEHLEVIVLKEREYLHYQRLLPREVVLVHQCEE